MPQNPLGVVYVLQEGTFTPLGVDADGAVSVVIAEGSTLALGNVGIEQTTPGTTNGVAFATSAAAGVGIVPVVSTGTVLTDSLVGKASAGNLYGAEVLNAGTAAEYVFVINSPTLPSNGTLSTGQIIAADYLGTADPKAVFGPYNPPEHFSAGLTLASSSTAPPVLTAAGTCFFKARVA